MSFTIQHPKTGASWATNDDGKIILSSTAASVYTVDESNYISNTNTGMCVRSQNGAMFETGHYGAMPEFEWTVGDDGFVSSTVYGPQWVGEDLTPSDAPFAWKKVLPTRASSLKAAASVAPAPVAAPVTTD